jgi:flagellar biosynthesis/type III secretory pathway protein FliH
MSTHETQQKLIDELEQWRDDECLRLLDRAREEALELLRNSHQRARRHVHEAVDSERARVRVRIGAARAELETLRRQHRQQLGSIILETVREHLPEVLAERWADPAARKAWIRNTAAQALQRLPRGRWTVRHALCFQASDYDTLLQALGDLGAHEPELVSDPKLDAGLIVECQGVRLDASVAGLLSDREAVEARLLALMELEDVI